MPFNLPSPPPAPRVLAHDLPGRLWPMLRLFVRARLFWVIGTGLPPFIHRVLFASSGYAAKRITDAVLEAQAAGADVWAAVTDPLLLFAALMTGVFAVQACGWVLNYHTRFPMLADMRLTIFAYVQRHSANYFDNNLSGKIAHKTAILPEQLNWLVECWWFHIMPSLGVFLTALFYFMDANVWFGVAAIGWLVLYFGACILAGYECARRAGVHNDAKTLLTGRIVDTLINIKNVIFFAAHDRENDHIGAQVTVAMTAQRRFFLAVVLLMRCTQHMLNIVMWVGLYAGAAYAWSEKMITAGDFVMITTLGGMIIARAQELGDLMPEFFDYLGSAQESISTLVMPRDILDKPNAADLHAPRGGIMLTDVDFAYDGRQRVFEKLNLAIPPGQRVGLIGQSGAGKSTLVSLLLRLHDIQGGHISIDGQDVRDVTQDSLHRRIAVIPQDTVLFHRSLIDNIRYSRADATAEDAVACARAAHADDFINLLPKAYDTLVGERGVKLSGGQRQRIAIARALLKNAPILILDEATSALDSESEAAIQAAMLTAMQGRTVIAIAHRLSTIHHLDRLIVLDKGRVVEDGSHAELLARGGIYANLWRKQSGGFLPGDGAKPAADEQPVLPPAPARMPDAETDPAKDV